MGNMILTGFDGITPIFEDEDKVPTLQELHELKADLIRRGDAIEAIRRERNIEALLDIPAVEPKRGEWIYSHEGTIAAGWYCSNCGKHGHKENYCPECGAKMKRGK